MVKQPPNQSAPVRRAPSIKIAFQTLARTFRHSYENLGTILMISVLWYIGALFILPLGAVTAAVHRVTQPMTEERAANWRTFFVHLRADLRWSSLLFVVLAIGVFVLQGNIGFYNAAPASGLRMLSVLFLALLIVWSGITLFAFPLALRQQEPHLRTTLRNALVMTMANAPGVLVSLLLLLLLTAILLFLPPLFLLLPGVTALWGQENARLLLVAGGYIQKDEIADRERA